MNEARAWFPDLDPPEGGERRLRVALRARSAAPAWGWAPVASACAVLVIALAVLPRWHERTRVERAVRTAWIAPEAPLVEHGKARELPSGEPDVRLYLVTLSPAPARH